MENSVRGASRMEKGVFSGFPTEPDGTFCWNQNSAGISVSYSSSTISTISTIGIENTHSFIEPPRKPDGCDEVERPAPTASSAKTWSLLERHKGGTVP